ncbi:uncharacterized protein SPSK_02037 [Sporothrix schenckii 1099-18]|uniref:Uncharacterized protein n=1 Tax=Sporothrix schenckii 1099-18 TaxID=1397361 RepID=A0A0F2MCV4_SPOSC|nr:uncharacterized protein SPSK_02037 [Sporothrix schenckii 1099-18]KJR87513.1 hypothetical protein SPSK_02037 [Sporothrix schenckii 1099-18]
MSRGRADRKRFCERRSESKKTAVSVDMAMCSACGYGCRFVLVVVRQYDIVHHVHADSSNAALCLGASEARQGRRPRRGGQAELQRIQKQDKYSSGGVGGGRRVIVTINEYDADGGRCENGLWRKGSKK